MIEVCECFFGIFIWIGQFTTDWCEGLRPIVTLGLEG